MSAYRHCITESSADRQRQFEEALLFLMTGRPLSQISIQDICGQVGLSRKSFYRYFSSKEACLTALVDHAILDYRTEPLLNQGAPDALTHYFHYWLSRRTLLDVLLREQMTDLLLQRSIISVYEEHDFYQTVPSQDSDAGLEKVLFMTSGLICVLLNWHKTGCEKTPAQLAAALSEFLPRHSHGVF